MLRSGARWTADRIPDQHGRTAVVTGANAGVGYQVALVLAQRGARVVMACRDLVRAGEAAERIAAEVPGAQLEVYRLDLADLGSVAEFADAVTRSRSRLDLLVNNAGLMSKERQVTVDGFELMFGVNYLGHYALTARLLPLLLAAPGSRVVMTSSLTYRFGRIDLDDPMFDRRGYGIWPAYFQSKLATVLFARELDRRLTEAGTATLSVVAHPGIAATDIGPKAGLGDPGTSPKDAVVGRIIMQPALAGAMPTLRAATAPEVAGGEFYGPRFVIRGAARRERLVGRARDADRARSLWEASAQLVNIEPVIG